MQQKDHLIRCEQVSMTTDETVISWELVGFKVACRCTNVGTARITCTLFSIEMYRLDVYQLS